MSNEREIQELKDAIEHCWEVVHSCNNKECANDHIKLAKWLEELLQIKEKK